MKIKISEATPLQIDYLVAKCEGKDKDCEIHAGNLLYGRVTSGFIQYKPSTIWAQGGPIIEREKIGVWWAHHVVDDEGNAYGNHWYAETGLTDDSADERHVCMTGETPLIAAMRCYVASKLGDEVEVPDELKGE